MADDRRERLETLRTQLEQALATCSENMLPQLAGQYRATLADIAALPPLVEKVSVKDELKAKRAGRVAAAKAGASAAGKAVKRGG
jgi:hypothetical protein